MSDWDDDDNDGNDNSNNNSGGGLRKQLEQALAEAKQLKEANAKLQKEARTSKVSTVLAAKGLDAKVAKLIPADVAATDEAIGKWLDEFGDLFNLKQQEAEKPAEPETVTEDDAEAFEAQQEYIATMRQMGVVGGGLLPPAKAQDLLAKINDPNMTHEGLIALISAHGGGAGSG